MDKSKDNGQASEKKHPTQLTKNKERASSPKSSSLGRSPVHPRILLPTNCSESFKKDCVDTLDALFSSGTVTFLHIVPNFSKDYSPCFSKDDDDFASSVAEKKLYDFVKNITFKGDFKKLRKILKGDVVEKLRDETGSGEYDVLMLREKGFCHNSDLNLNIHPIISSSKIPVIVFDKGGKKTKGITEHENPFMKVNEGNTNFAYGRSDGGE